jgi:hypothetical protein
LADVKIMKQCMVETPDEVGTLAKVLGAAKAAGVNVKGICAYSMEGKGHFMILSDACDDACGAFKSGGWKCTWDEVVAVAIPDKVGAGAELAGKLAAAGINIEYTYGSNAGGADFLAVFKTSDNAKAAQVLK